MNFISIYILKFHGFDKPNDIKVTMLAKSNGDLYVELEVADGRDWVMYDTFTHPFDWVNKDLNDLEAFVADWLDGLVDFYKKYYKDFELSSNVRAEAIIKLSRLSACHRMI